MAQNTKNLPGVDSSSNTTIMVQSDSHEGSRETDNVLARSPNLKIQNKNSNPEPESQRETHMNGHEQSSNLSETLDEIQAKGDDLKQQAHQQYKRQATTQPHSHFKDQLSKRTFSNGTRPRQTARSTTSQNVFLQSALSHNINSSLKQTVKVEYVENDCQDLRGSLLESVRLDGAEIKNRNLEADVNVIYKERRPIQFKEAYRRKDVKLELKGERERPHGLVRPFSTHQLFTWVFLAFNVASQMVLIAFGPSFEALLNFDVRILLLIVSLSLDVIVFVLGLITTMTDPSDMTVRIERYHRMTYQKFDDSTFEFYCNHCDTNVKQYSKHCGRCQRCTEQFDHHCVWLNNCIGYNNYKPFFVLLIAVICHALDVIGLALWYVLPHFPYNQGYEDFEVLDVLAYILVLVNALAVLLIGYLLVYHIWLVIVKKTTYQHIVEQRVRQQEKEERKAAERAKKQSKIGNKVVKGTPRMRRRKPKLSVCGDSEVPKDTEQYDQMSEHGLQKYAPRANTYDSQVQHQDGVRTVLTGDNSSHVSKVLMPDFSEQTSLLRNAPGGSLHTAKDHNNTLDDKDMSMRQREYMRQLEGKNKSRNELSFDVSLGSEISNSQLKFNSRSLLNSVADSQNTLNVSEHESQKNGNSNQEGTSPAGSRESATPRRFGTLIYEPATQSEFKAKKRSNFAQNRVNSIQQFQYNDLSDARRQESTQFFLNQTVDRVHVVSRMKNTPGGETPGGVGVVGLTPGGDDGLDDQSFLTVQLQPNLVKNVFEPSVKMDISQLDVDFRSDLLSELKLNDQNQGSILGRPSFDQKNILASLANTRNNSLLATPQP